MHLRIKLLALLLSLPTLAQATTTLQGVVMAETPFADSKVLVIDSHGKQLITQADDEGRYLLTIDTLTPPLTLSATAAGGDNCLHNYLPRTRCMASLLLTVDKNAVNTANITPFSDRLVAEVAVALGFIGPEQFVERTDSLHLPPDILVIPLANFREGMKSAFNELGLDAEQIDPIRTPIVTGDAITMLLSVINHNRNYDNNSGEAGGVTLTDSAFRPIAGLQSRGPWETNFDLRKAQRDKDAITSAKTRILIVSDSTAATYELSRFPRMGWGQVFQDNFRADAGVTVLNGARAGRSSRDFYNEGWYQQMGRYLQPGDYVFIAHGHNDQNCNADKPLRGPADVQNLCTYPNDDIGNLQYPEGKPEMSFQHSLERYIHLAREKGAIPVLFTPTTRVKNAEGKTAFQQGSQDVVVSGHRTDSKPGYLFTGDYIATIKQTAERNKVPLIDLEKATIAFANDHASDWMDYWLAVDANDHRYPWYKTQNSGTRTHPDTTHFQQKGAEAVSGMVAEAIRQTPALNDLAEKLAH